MKTTAYCPCSSCSKEYGRNTATGAIATEGVTVAVDPNIFPYGTEITIDGNTYIAQDCGGGVNGNHIDIFFDNHEDVKAYGVQYKEITYDKSTL